MRLVFLLHRTYYSHKLQISHKQSPLHIGRRTSGGDSLKPFAADSYHHPCIMLFHEPYTIPIDPWMKQDDEADADSLLDAIAQLTTSKESAPAMPINGQLQNQQKNVSV